MIASVRNGIFRQVGLSLLVPTIVPSRTVVTKEFISRTPFDRIPKLPLPHPLSKKPFLNPRLYKRPDTETEHSIPYKDISEELLQAGVTSKQVDIWKDTFVSLEEKNLPTNDFSRGFIQLAKAKATDIELDSYVHTVELLLVGSKGKISLDDLTSRYLDIVQRKNLSERARSRLLLNEQVKVLENSVKDGSLSLKSLVVIGLKLGAKLIFFLLKLI